MHALLTEREKYIYIMFCKACVKATETEEQREREIYSSQQIDIKIRYIK